MNTKPQARPYPPYLAAAVPFLLSGGQVLFVSAPLLVLWIGIALSVAVFAVLWAGAIWLQRAKPRFGKAVPLRVWQAPVVWLPVLIAIVILLFYGHSA